ncbi:SpoIIE family protein phosphatase [Amycolatopsis acidicola]|uniref:histidine kinase n=1 Tax=Amycolatopsis acidicola TaxID=2596893 RepID=A0A5N0V0E2_9PSEU|nr:SpoIIE family protein phosphatase [Amycolatopsis acidicola]KAA9158759.1 SpoIIE family protein phosphatase [Amycolatopsis acidicola]
MREDIPAELAAAIALGGEMGRRVSEYDWSAHPLGPPRDWPPAVCSAVALALTSRFPIVLWLDPAHLTQVYNDAAIPLVGEKHPAAFGRSGREVWWEVWDSIEEMVGGVFRESRATWSDDQLLPLMAGGRLWDRHFTFSFGPILSPGGRADGIFCAATETTARVLAARRLNLVNEVSTSLLETRTVDGAVAAITSACAGHGEDLPFVAVYLDDAVKAKRLHSATAAARDLLPGTLEALAPADWSESGAHLVTGLRDSIPALASRFPGFAPEEALVLPLADAATGGAVLFGLNPRQPFDEQYRGFCRLLADQLAAAFAIAGSYERERRRADSLADLDRAKTAFLANVSHEFRTPLTLMLGPVEDAMAEAEHEPLQLKRLETVHRNAQRLLRLVNSLLDFSRTEAGKATAHRVRADVGALTAQIASSFAELCRQAGIDLVLACRPAFAEVDVQMWETVVLNLLSNAVKFTFAGSITVEVAPAAAGQVRITFTDTGTGIPREDLDKLFDRFYRAGNTRGRSVEGSGIGLSLVHGLVELHEGTIEIDSELDFGTAVTIRLPAAADGTPVTTPAPAAGNSYLAEAKQWLGSSPGTGARTGRKLVLIVDDNADLRRHLDRILSERWDTCVFGDGESALSGMREHRPDAVVTDLMMPGMDGFELVAAIRADPLLAATPVLMLSARADLESAGEGLAGGADDYLPKPFSSRELLNRVTARLTAVERERAARDLEEAATRRAQALAEFGSVLNAATSVEEILGALLSAPLTPPDSAALGLLENGGDRIRIDYAGSVHAELRDRYHVVAIDAPVPMAAAVRSGEPIVFTDPDDVAPRFQVAARDALPSVRAAVVHPIRSAGGFVVGAISVHWNGSHKPGDVELEVAARVAELTGPALDRVLAAEREHRIATDFQDQLLDLDQSSVNAVVAAVYQPAAEAMRVGGDWYLVAPLSDTGPVALSVGDVVGHGLPAATVMSKLRSAIGAAALTVRSPSEVLDLAERYAASVPGAACTTVAYAVLDSGAHSISYACAGHPYPLLVTPEGVRFLEHGRHPPLAALSCHASGRIGEAELPPGSLVVLYTDGLIERPGESISDGFGRLADVAAGLRHVPAAAVCTELLRRMTPPGGYTDDVAILAVRPVGTTPDTFVASVQADAAELPVLRHRLRAWLEDLRLGDEKQYDVLVGVGEAVSNGMEHGSGMDRRKTVSVEVFAGEHTISVTVGDRGRWLADSSASRRTALRGRGLTLINGLADHVETVRSARGTQVTMRYRRGPDSASQEEKP